MASSGETDASMGAQALVAAVQSSDNGPSDVTQSIHSHGDADEATAAGHSKRHKWLERLVPGIEKLAAKYHAGNFVALRDPSKPPGSNKFFESMPLYERIGMHLLFCGKEQVKFLESGKIEGILREQSLKQGAIYDTPESVKSIPSFIETYKIDISELLEQDLSQYKNFNEFFFRKLKPGARPVQNPDPRAFCSAADCRLTVFQSVEEAEKFWIKGDEFTISRLLTGSKSETVPADCPFLLDTSSSPSLAIFRLAPADYHRFHSPLTGTLVSGPHDISGTYYTVNPQAVNEVNFDVFTANKRSVMYIKHEGSGQIVAFVAIGALLVAAIGWSKKVGDKVEKGEELGWFAYGGSTVITVFPSGLIKFDDDLRENSGHALETLIHVGDSLGTMV